MGKINTYVNADPVKLDDKIIGTSTDGFPQNSTRNFLISDLLALFQQETPSEGYSISGFATTSFTFDIPKGKMLTDFVAYSTQGVNKISIGKTLGSGEYSLSELVPVVDLGNPSEVEPLSIGLGLYAVADRTIYVTVNGSFYYKAYIK